MPLSFRRFATLLLPLALLPLLAHADPWNALGEAVLALLVLGAALLVEMTLTLALVVLSYQRPARHGLYLAQLVGLALNALAGLLLAVWQPLVVKVLPLYVNPFWELVLPLGLWLNGLRWARQARTDAWRRGWVALAVAALSLLLGLLPYQLLNAWLTSHHARPNETLLQVAFIAVAAVVALGSWAVVARQLRSDGLSAAIWQPWWQLPLLVAVLSAAHSVLTTWLQFVFDERIQLPALALLRIGGQVLLVSWVLGVLALLVLRPGRPAQVP